MSLTCPICKRPLEVPDELEEYIRSIRQIGCDDCVWRIARERFKQA